MNPVELERDLVELGLEKARTKAAAFLLDKEVKSVEAIEYKRARGSETQGDAAMTARASESYRDACQKAAEAIERAEAARVRHDALMAKFEAWRSLSASKREQIRQGVFQ